jgi:hypothetical protein
MTLAALMDSDVTDVFLNADEHAETITYKPDNNDPQSIKAIVDRLASLSPVAVADGLRISEEIEVTIASDISNGIDVVGDGDYVIVDGKQYKFVERMEHGYGIHRLRFVEITSLEKSGPNYRIARS